MTNDELMNIYKKVLEDWNVLQEKFNEIEDKSINNIKHVFADQCDQQGLFFIIKYGCIENYVSNGMLDDPFTIKYKDYLQPYVCVEDVKKRIESLS